MESIPRRWTLPLTAMSLTARGLPCQELGRNYIEDVVQFIPAYNGVSSDFDAKHAVINYNGITSMGLPRTLNR